MADRIRRACDQCLGTDTQYECERGQCYAQHYQQQMDEQRSRDLEEEDRMDCYPIWSQTMTSPTNIAKPTEAMKP